MRGPVAARALRRRRRVVRELAKALMIGEEDGMLKILVSPEDRRLLGVHVIGSQATDLVHKVAGLDAQNRLRDLC